MYSFNIVITFIISLFISELVNAQQSAESEISPDPMVNYDWFKIADNRYPLRYQHHHTLFATTSQILDC